MRGRDSQLLCAAAVRISPDTPPAYSPVPARIPPPTIAWRSLRHGRDPKRGRSEPCRDGRSPTAPAELQRWPAAPGRVQPQALTLARRADLVPRLRPVAPAARPGAKPAAFGRATPWTALRVRLRQWNTPYH